MRIHFESIPHKEQRYETVGDWWLDAADVLQVRVSRMSDPRYERLIVIHEIVEFLLESQLRGGDIKAMRQLVVDTDIFDKAFEATREPDDDESEPGCEPDCPVYQGHMAAMAIEQVCAMILGVNYNAYADEVAAFDQSKD